MATLAEFLEFVEQHPGARLVASKRIAEAAEKIGLFVETSAFVSDDRLYAIAPELSFCRRVIYAPRFAVRHPMCFAQIDYRHSLLPSIVQAGEHLRSE